MPRIFIQQDPRVEGRENQNSYYTVRGIACQAARNSLCRAKEGDRADSGLVWSVLREMAGSPRSVSELANEVEVPLAGASLRDGVPFASLAAARAAHPWPADSAWGQETRSGLGTEVGVGWPGV